MKKIILTLALALIALGSHAELKYVFVIIGDGMGIGHVMATETYNRATLGNKDNLLMMQLPVTSFAMTYSKTGSITDSAAAGTALATGTKTRNGMIGMNADTIAVNSIATQLKRRGWGVGVVTSVGFDDATPAAQYAHQASRKMYAEIGRDGAHSDFDFIGGSYTLMARKDKAACEGIFDTYRQEGYAVVDKSEKVGELNGGKVLLVGGYQSNPDNIGYTIDSIAGAARLKDMAAACIGHLQKVSPDRFYVMIEGGNIDLAAHANDGAAVIKEVLAFQETIREAYNFYLAHPDETLIVITADHDTGGLTIGVRGGDSQPLFAAIDHQKMSKETFNDYCLQHTDMQWDEMKQLISDKLGLWSHVKVTADEEEQLKTAFAHFKANDGTEEKTLYKDFNAFSATLFDLINHKNGFGFTTFGHTGNPVPVFAVGKGSDAFSHLNNNMEIPQKIRKLLNIK